MRSAAPSTAFGRLLAAASLVVASVAHAAHGEIADFGDGVLHVFAWSGPMLGAIAVGLWSMAYSWRRAWLLPVAFAAAVAAGAYGGAGEKLTPTVGTLIVATVILLGMLVYGSRTLSIPSAFAIVVVFGAIHGYSHGAQAGAGDFGRYVLGAASATLALCVAGMAAGLMLRLVSRHGMHVAGAAIAAAGLWFAVGAA